MEYRKPTASVLAKAINSIERSNTAMKGSPFLDGQATPYICFPDTFNPSASAYEADE